MSFSCQVCNYSGKTKQAYERHMSSNKHHNRIENYKKKYKCSCGNTYMSSQSLYMHKRSCLHNSSIIAVKTRDSQANDTITFNDMENQIKILKVTISTLQKQVNILTDKLEEESKKSHNFCIIQRQGRRHIKKEVREEVVKCQENKCNLCNSTLSKYFQIDHITALQYGGTDEFDNLQALCCECHCKKSIIENTFRKKIRTAIGDIIEDALHEENQGT